MNLFESGPAFIDPFKQAVVKMPKMLTYNLQYSSKGSAYSLPALAEILMQTAPNPILAVTCVALWAFALLIPASRYLSPMQSLLSLVRTAYDVGTARAANAQIVVPNPGYRGTSKSFQNNDDPTHDWGYGQILPLVMLLLPILSNLDMTNG